MPDRFYQIDPTTGLEVKREILPIKVGRGRRAQIVGAEVPSSAEYSKLTGTSNFAVEQTIEEATPLKGLFGGSYSEEVPLREEAERFGASYDPFASREENIKRIAENQNGLGKWLGHIGLEFAAALAWVPQQAAGITGQLMDNFLENTPAGNLITIGYADLMDTTNKDSLSITKEDKEAVAKSFSEIRNESYKGWFEMMYGNLDKFKTSLSEQQPNYSQMYDQMVGKEQQRFDAGWWWDQSAAFIQSTVGFGLFMAGSSTGVSAILKTNALRSALTSVSPSLTGAIQLGGSAIVNNFLEGNLMGSDAYLGVMRKADDAIKKQYEILDDERKIAIDNASNQITDPIELQETINAINKQFENNIKDKYKEARKIAGIAVGDMVFRNIPMVVSDALAYKGIIKGIGITRNLMREPGKFLSKRAWSNFGKDLVKPGWENWAVQGLQQAGEEMYQAGQQGIVEMTAQRDLGIAPEDITYYDKIKAYDESGWKMFLNVVSSDQAIDEGIAGFVGGPGQRVFHNLITGRYLKSDYESKLQLWKDQQDIIKRNIAYAKGKMQDINTYGEILDTFIKDGDPEVLKTVQDMMLIKLLQDNLERGTIENFERVMQDQRAAVSNMSDENVEAIYGSSKSDVIKRIDNHLSLAKDTEAQWLKYNNIGNRRDLFANRQSAFLAKHLEEKMQDKLNKEFSQALTQLAGESKIADLVEEYVSKSGLKERSVDEIVKFLGKLNAAYGGDENDVNLDYLVQESGYDVRNIMYIAEKLGQVQQFITDLNRIHKERTRSSYQYKLNNILDTYSKGMNSRDVKSIDRAINKLVGMANNEDYAKAQLTDKVLASVLKLHEQKQELASTANKKSSDTRSTRAKIGGAFKSAKKKAKEATQSETAAFHAEQGVKPGSGTRQQNTTNTAASQRIGQALNNNTPMPAGPEDGNLYTEEELGNDSSKAIRDTAGAIKDASLAIRDTNEAIKEEENNGRDASHLKSYAVELENNLRKLISQIVTEIGSSEEQVTLRGVTLKLIEMLGNDADAVALARTYFNIIKGEYVAAAIREDIKVAEDSKRLVTMKGKTMTFDKVMDTIQIINETKGDNVIDNAEDGGKDHSNDEKGNANEVDEIERAQARSSGNTSRVEGAGAFVDRKLDFAHDAMSFLSRVYTYVTTAIGIKKKDVTNELFSGMLQRYVLDAREMKVGSKITVVVLDNDNAEVYESGAKGEKVTITWGEKKRNIALMYPKDTNPAAYEAAIIDSIPMAIIDSKNNHITYVHDKDWINGENVQPQNVAEDADKLSQLRKHIYDLHKQQKSFTTKITSYKPGPFNKTVNNEQGLVGAMMPGLTAFAVAKDKKLFTGKGQEFTHSAFVLNDMEKLQNGKVYVIHEYGWDHLNDRPTFIAVPVTNIAFSEETSEGRTLGEDIVLSVVTAMTAYSKGKEHLTKTGAKVPLEFAEHILKTTGINVYTAAGIRTYLEMFLNNFNIGSADKLWAKATESKVGYLNTIGQSAPESKQFFVMKGNEIEFSLGKGVQYVSLTTNDMSAFGEAAVDAKLQRITELLLQVGERAARFSTNLTNLGENSTVPMAVLHEGAVEYKSYKYQDLMKATHKTNIFSVNAGTEQAPRHVITIQPVIRFDVSEVKFDNSDWRKKVVESTKEESKTEPATEATPEEKPAPKKKTGGRADKFRKAAEDTTKNTTIEGDENTPNTVFAIREMSDEQVAQMKQQNRDVVIAELGMVRQTSVVKYLVALLQKKVLESKDLKINVFNTLEERRKQWEKTRDELNVALSKLRGIVLEAREELEQAKKDGDAEGVAELEAFISERETGRDSANPSMRMYASRINEIELVLGNWESVVSVTFNQVALLDGGFRMVTPGDDETNHDLDIDLMEGGDQESVVLESNPNWNEYSSLTYDAKDNIGREVKALLCTLTTYNPDGSVKLNYLGEPEPMDFDAVYDTLKSLVSNKPTDWVALKQTMLKAIKDYNHFWLRELVDKLEAAGPKMKNQFVYNLSGTFLSMRMIMWSQDSEGNFIIQDTPCDAFEEQNSLRETWVTNFENKDYVVPVLDVNGPNDEYHVITQEAKEKIDDLYKRLQETISGTGASISIPEGATPSEANYYASQATKGNKPAGIPNVALVREFLNMFGIDVSDAVIKGIIQNKYRPSGQVQSYERMINDRNKGLIGSLYQISKVITSKPMEADWRTNPLRLPAVVRFARFALNYEVRKFNSSVRVANVMAQQIGKKRYLSSRLDELLETEVSFAPYANPRNNDILKKLNEAFPDEITNKEKESGEEPLFGRYRYVGDEEELTSGIVDPTTGQRYDVREIEVTVKSGDETRVEKRKVTNAPMVVVTSRILTRLKKTVAFSSGSSWVNDILKLNDGEPIEARNGLYIVNTDSPTFNNLDVWVASLEPIKHRFAKSRSNADMSSLVEGDIELFKLGMIFSNSTDLSANKARIIRLLYNTTSDKKLVYGLNVAAFKFELNHDGPGLSDKTLDDLYDILVAPEIARIEIYNAAKKKSVDNSHLMQYNYDGYDKAASKFTLLPSLNNIGLFDQFGYLLEDIHSDENKTKIKAEIQRTVDLLVAEKRALWDNYGIGKSDEEAGTKYAFINKSYIESGIIKGEDVVGYAVTDMVLQYMVGYANMFQLFIGDPALFYKSEVGEAVRTRNSISEEEWASMSIEERYTKYTDADRIEEMKNLADNIGKRLAADIAPRQEIADSNTERPTYRQGFMKDIKTESQLYKELDKMFKGYESKTARDPKKTNPAYPYSKITVADGQEYATWQETLWIVFKQGKISEKEYKEAFDILTKQENELDATGRLSENTRKLSAKVADILIFQPMKPVASGMVEDGTVDLRYYIKSSTLTLVPELVEGTLLDDLRKIMKVNKLDRLAFDSAVKNGNVANSVRVFDNDGNIIPEAFSENYFDGNGVNIPPSMRILPRKNFGIQMEVPLDEYKTEINRVTQASKNLFVNILDEEGFKYNGRDDWDGRHLQDEYFRIYNKLFKLYKKEFLDSLGMKTIDDPVDRAMLKDLLLREANKRNFPLPERQMLAMDDYIDHVAFSPSADRFESLLNSLVANAILKTKMRGKSFVTVSEAGFKPKVLTGKEGEEATKRSTGIVWVKGKKANNLKPYQVKDNGEMQACQIIIPWKFIDSRGESIYMDKFLTKDGELDTDRVPEEVLKMLLMRIPGQGLNSQVYVEVVGFSTKLAGDIVVAPKELVAQTGMDFDIDKLYSYIYNVSYRPGNNTPKLILDELADLEQQVNNFYTGLESRHAKDLNLSDQYKATREAIRDLHKKINALPEGDPSNETSIKYFKRKLQEQYDIRNSIYDQLGVTLDRSISSAKNRIHDIKDQYFVLSRDNDMNTKEGLQNAILDIHLAIMQNSKVFAQVVAPVDYWELERLSEEIKEARKTNDRWKETSTFTMLSDGYQTRQFKIATAGKNGVSVFSLDNTFNVLAQRVDGLRMKYDANNDLIVKFGNVVSKGVLSDVYTLPGAGNREKRYKSTIHTGYQSAAVDNQKLGGVLGNLNINTHTFGVIGLLNQLGFAEEVPWFISQDIILDYIEELQKLRSTVNGYTKNAEKMAADNVRNMSRYWTEEFDPTNSDHLAFADVSLDEMKAFVKNGSTAFNYRMAQQAFLSKFIMLSSVADRLGELKRKINLDAKGYGKNLIASQLAEEGAKDVLFGAHNIVNEDKMLGQLLSEEKYNNLNPKQKEDFVLIPRIMDGNVVKNMYFRPTTINGFVVAHAVFLNNKLWNKYFPYNHPAIKVTVDRIEEASWKEKMFAKSQLEFRRKIYNNIKSFIYTAQNSGLVDNETSINQERKRLLFRYTNLDKDPITIPGMTAMDANNILSGTKTAILLSDEMYTRLESSLDADGKMVIRVGAKFYTAKRYSSGRSLAEVKALIAGKPEAYKTLAAALDNLRNTASDDLPTKAFFDIGKSGNIFVLKERTDVQENLPLAYLVNHIKNGIVKVNLNGAQISYAEFNDLIKMLEPHLAMEGAQSSITMRAGAKDDLTLNKAYIAFMNMLQNDFDLNLNFNGINYTTRRLAQELINVMMLSGGIQEAIQFVKVIPISYLYTVGFLQRMTRMFDNTDKLWESILNIPADSPYYESSPFERQYFQHNPEDAIRLADDLSQIVDLDGNLLKPKDIATLKSFRMRPDSPTGEVFALKRSKGSKENKHDEYPKFVAYYNRGGAKDNKYILFEYNGDRYNRIPTLGTFGMKEYNANVTEDSVQNSLLKHKKLPIETKETPTTIPVPGNAESKLTDIEKYCNSIGITASNDFNVQLVTAFPKIVEAITRPTDKAMARYIQNFLPFVPAKLKIVFESFGKHYEVAPASYTDSTNTIAINTDDAAKMSSPERILTVFVHEIVHAITKHLLNNYALNQTEGMSKELVAAIGKLAEVHKYARERMLASPSGNNFRKYEKLLNMMNEGSNELTKKDMEYLVNNRELYGFTSIDEMVTGFFDNRGFRSELARIKAKEENKSLLDRIIDALTELFDTLLTPYLDKKQTALFDTASAINDFFKAIAGKEELDSIATTSKKGINISSYETGLGKQLSNFYPTEIQFRGKIYRSAEEAYQANKSTLPDLTDENVLELMIKIISAKLDQHPEIRKAIDNAGAMEFLLNSTHNLVKEGHEVKTDRWTGKDGLFMRALREAYIRPPSKQDRGNVELEKKLEVLRSGAPVYISYTNNEGESSERVISDIKIRLQSNGQYLIEAYDSKRKEVRVFRLDRMNILPINKESKDSMYILEKKDSYEFTYDDKDYIVKLSKYNETKDIADIEILLSNSKVPITQSSDSDRFTKLMTRARLMEYLDNKEEIPSGVTTPPVTYSIPSVDVDLIEKIETSGQIASDVSIQDISDAKINELIKKCK